MRLGLIISLLILATVAQAGTIQYETSTLNVTGFTPDGKFDVQPGRTILEGVDEPDWAVPSLCPVDGRAPWAWSRVVTTTPLVLQLNPTLTFFRCRPVTDAGSLFEAVRQEVRSLASSVLSNGNAEIMVLLHEVLRVCPPGDNSTNCPEARTAGATVAQLFGGKALLRTFLEEAREVVNDAQALKVSKGW